MRILIVLFLWSCVQAYTTKGRFGHTAVLINDSIYFYGGDTTVTVNRSAWSSELFVLPIHSTYSVIDPPWKPASGSQDVVGGPAVYSHVAFESEGNMIVMGGVMQQTDPSVMDEEPMAYSYNYNLGRWNLFSLPSGNHLNRQGAAASTTENGITFIWGGKRTDTLKNGPRPTLPTDMYRFDSVFPENSGTISNQGQFVPPLRYAHTQTLLPDDRIVVLGGFDSETGDAISLSDIWIYDISSSSWSQVKATLDRPFNRSSHSQVLMPDGVSIVVYGGYDGYHVFNDVAVLDTRTWSWTIKNTNAAVQGRAEHTATLVGTNMIVVFGFTGVSNSLTLMSDIEVLDTVTWSWTSEYNPSVVEVDRSDKLNAIGEKQDGGSTSPSISIVAGAVTGGLVVFLFILIAIYFLYLRNQKQKKEQKSDNQDIESINNEKVSKHIEHKREEEPQALPPLPPALLAPPLQPVPPPPLPVKYRRIPQPLRIDTKNLLRNPSHTLPSPWTPIRPLKRDEPYLASPISSTSFDFYPGDSVDWLNSRVVPISKPDDRYYPTPSASSNTSGHHSASTLASFFTCQNVDIF